MFHTTVGVVCLTAADAPGRAVAEARRRACLTNIRGGVAKHVMSTARVSVVSVVCALGALGAGCVRGFSSYVITQKPAWSGRMLVLTMLMTGARPHRCASLTHTVHP